MLMTHRPIVFELASSFILITSGYWLLQNEFANGGLMFVGCLLALVSMASFLGQRRPRLQTLTHVFQRRHSPAAAPIDLNPDLER